MRCRHESTIRGIRRYSALPGGPFRLAIALGVGLIVGGVCLPQHRKWMIGIGIGLIVVALFTMVAIVALAAFDRLTGSGSSGGSSSSGGYSGGGFSGGGGASGSW